jgi:anti-anti-sigma factor
MLGGIRGMMRHPQFEIRQEVEPPRGLLTPIGELDMATVPELEKAVRSMLGEGVSELRIDLSQLQFIDSSGLRFLIGLHDEACETGWTLGLLRPAEAPRELFRITGLDEHLPLISEPVGG